MTSVEVFFAQLPNMCGTLAEFPTLLALPKPKQKPYRLQFAKNTRYSFKVLQSRLWSLGVNFLETICHSFLDPLYS